MSYCMHWSCKGRRRQSLNPCSSNYATNLTSLKEEEGTDSPLPRVLAMQKKQTHMDYSGRTWIARKTKPIFPKAATSIWEPMSGWGREAENNLAWWVVNNWRDRVRNDLTLSRSLGRTDNSKITWKPEQKSTRFQNRYKSFCTGIN